MPISDWINAILCVLSFSLAAISVVTVIITLRQNHRMIENSTRPYIEVYGDFTSIQGVEYFIIVKNFGASAATINRFKYDLDLSNCVDVSAPQLPFAGLEGTRMAPYQSFRAHINLIKALEMGDSVNFEVSYSYGNHVYNEKCVLNLKTHNGNLATKASTDGKELKIISNALQELIQRGL